MEHKEEKFWSPYKAGIMLGLVLLASFLLLGKGLGASGGAARLGAFALHAVAPEHVEANPYLAGMFTGGKNPLDHFLVFLGIGVFLGGIVSSFAAGRLRPRVVRGPRIGIPGRLALAMLGGTIMGMAARMARGCTSGQAMSGGAMMSVGAWVFMLAIFVGGYAMAYFVRRQWT